MKLRKVIINGKEVYEPTDDNIMDNVIDIDEDGNVIENASDEREVYMNKISKKLDKYLRKNLPESVKNEINQVFITALEDMKQVDSSSYDKEDMDDFNEEIKDIYEDAVDKASEIYDDYLESLDDDNDEEDEEETPHSGKKSHTFSFHFDGKKSKFNFGDTFKKLDVIAMLPFMDDADIHELLEKLLRDDEAIKGIPLYALLPFLSTEDCDKLFIKSLDSKMNINPVTIAPFVSSACLSKVVDDYINGSYSDLKLEGLYPFLDSKDVKRLFDYLVTKNKK